MNVSIFQFHCNSEHKQVKFNKIKRGMYKSDIIFPNLQGITVFGWLLKFIFSIIFVSKMNNNSPRGKMFITDFVP